MRPQTFKSSPWAFDFTPSAIPSHPREKRRKRNKRPSAFDSCDDGVGQAAAQLATRAAITKYINIFAEYPSISVADSQDCKSSTSNSNPQKLCPRSPTAESVLPSRPAPLAVHDTVQHRHLDYKRPATSIRALESRMTENELNRPGNVSQAPRKILTPVPPSSRIKNLPQRCPKLHMPLQMPSQCTNTCASPQSVSSEDSSENTFEKIDDEDMENDWAIILPEACYIPVKRSAGRRISV